MRCGLLAAGVLAPILVTGCGSSNAPHGSPVHDTEVSPTSAARPVAELSLEGGFVPPGLAAIRPPTITVYQDGQVIADATRTVHLRPGEVSGLVSALTRDLAGRPATAVPSPGAPAVADAPTTVLRVLSGGAMRTVRVPAMDVLAPHQAYPRPLYDARDRLNRLAGLARSRGEPYTATRVRLIAEPADSRGGPALSWPTGIPAPRPTGALGTGVQDLSGPAAQLVVRHVPRGEGQLGGWRVFKDPTGHRLAMSWRYLLPGE